MPKPRRFKLTYDFFTAFAAIAAGIGGSISRAGAAHDVGTNETWGGVRRYAPVRVADPHLPDMQGQVDFDAVWEGVDPVEAEEEEGKDMAEREEELRRAGADLHALSKKGFEGELDITREAIDLSPNFRRHPGGNLIFALPSNIVDEKGSVTPLHLGDSDLFKGDGYGGSRVLKIVYDKSDYPVLPPIFIPGYRFGTMIGMGPLAGTNWMKVTPNDGTRDTGTPLNIEIYSRSADGTEAPLTSGQLERLRHVQEAVAFSNELKLERNHGDPVSGTVNAMAGLDFFGGVDAVLDIKDNMPLEQRGDDATVDLMVDLSDYYRLVPSEARGIRVRCDVTRYGSRPPVAFTDGGSAVTASLRGAPMGPGSPGAVVIRSSRQDESVDVGFEADVGGGRVMSLDSPHCEYYASEHNRKYGPNSRPNPSPAPESVVIPDQRRGPVR